MKPILLTQDQTEGMDDMANLSGLTCGRCGLFVFNGECDCIPMPAEAATEVGAEPPGRPRPIPAPLRWVMNHRTEVCMCIAVASAYWLARN